MGKLICSLSRREETNRKGEIEERRGLANNQISILEGLDCLKRKMMDVNFRKRVIPPFRYSEPYEVVLCL